MDELKNKIKQSTPEKGVKPEDQIDRSSIAIRKKRPKIRKKKTNNTTPDAPAMRKPTETTKTPITTTRKDAAPHDHQKKDADNTVSTTSSQKSAPDKCCTDAHQRSTLTRYLKTWAEDATQIPRLTYYIRWLMMLPNHAESDLPDNVRTMIEAFANPGNYPAQPIYAATIRSWRAFARDLQMHDGSAFHAPTDGINAACKYKIRLCAGQCDCKESFSDGVHVHRSPVDSQPAASLEANVNPQDEIGKKRKSPDDAAEEPAAKKQVVSMNTPDLMEDMSLQSKERADSDDEESDDDDEAIITPQDMFVLRGASRKRRFCLVEEEDSEEEKCVIMTMKKAVVPRLVKLRKVRYFTTNTPKTSRRHGM